MKVYAKIIILERANRAAAHFAKPMLILKRAMLAIAQLVALVEKTGFTAIVADPQLVMTAQTNVLFVVS